MDTLILTQELTNIIQEARRKHGDIKTIADKALQELKALPSNPSPQDISNIPNLTKPLILACKSQNVKLVKSATACIHRLVLIRALPRESIRDLVDGLHNGTSVTPVLEVQLKILQILPSIVQNYPSEIRGDPLFKILTVTSILLNSKFHPVVSTATATVQQLISSVYEHLKDEDDTPENESDILMEISLGDDKIKVRPCAYDAFWTFMEMCLMLRETEPQHIPLSPFPQSTIFDVIESILSHSNDLFRTHREQAFVLQTVLMPLVTTKLAEKLKFTPAVRFTRLLRLVIHHHLDLALEECETALSLMNHLIDTEPPNSWRRVISLEVYSGIYAKEDTLFRLYQVYDKDSARKSIIKDNLSLFVRVASERPGLIGLGSSPSFPIPPAGSRDLSDQAALDADTGLAAGNQGNADAIGISNQWSFLRVPCIEQFDKPTPMPIPDTYVYTLILSSINFIADGLAEIVLPVSGLSEDRKRRKRDAQRLGPKNPDPPSEESTAPPKPSKYQKRPIPVNPLELTSHLSYPKVLAASEILEQAWPAILAACSTFLYSALDAEIFRQLVRSVQKIAQVSGLLRMEGPRNAFLSFLNKAAVPAQAIPTLRNFNNPSSSTAEAASSGTTTASRVLLTVESLMSNAARRMSGESQRQSYNLNVRNLLCMRALVNLAIALGPTLGTAWSIVLENVRYIDLLAIPSARPSSQVVPTGSGAFGKDGQDHLDPSSGSINNELFSLGTALNRLYQSTSDFPNNSFQEVLSALCHLLSFHATSNSKRPSVSKDVQDSSVAQTAPSLVTMHTLSEFHEQEYINTLKRLKSVCLSNLQRFGLDEANESGWDLVTSQLESMIADRRLTREIRIMAAQLVSSLCHDLLTNPILGDLAKSEDVQRRSINALVFRYKETYDISPDDVDMEIQTLVFQTTHSIIEHLGDYLGPVWSLIFSMMTTAFKDRTPKEYHAGLEVNLVSIPIARASFSVVELVCSDYLNALPHSCFIALVNILFQFCAQSSDMNMAFTAVGHYWNLSDHLLRHVDSSSFDKLVSETSVLNVLECPAGFSDGDTNMVIPQTWIVLLMRLTMAVQDQRSELRDSALQILLRIFQNYGPRFSPEGWNFCCQQIVLKMLSNNASCQAASYPPKDGTCGTEEVQSQIETTRLMLSGVGDLLATNMSSILKSPGFPIFWKDLIFVLNAFLDVHCHGINSAVYSTITSLLTSTEGTSISINALDQLRDTWVKQFPAQLPPDPSIGNQEPFENYVRSFAPLYRHCSGRLRSEDIEEMVVNLVRCVRDSDSMMHRADYDNHTPVQNLVMESIKIVDTSVSLSVAVIILKKLTELVDLQLSPPKNRKLTFIAVAKTAIEQILRIYLDNLKQTESLVETGVLGDILKSLHSAIRTKGIVDSRCRTEPAWRKATAAAISIIRHSLVGFDNNEKDGDSESYILMTKASPVTAEAWTWIASVCDAIATGPHTFEVPNISSQTQNQNWSEDADEDFDVKHLGLLLDLISRSGGKSRLGAGLISDRTREEFAAALVKNSIFHLLDMQYLPPPVLKYSTFVVTGPVSSSSQTMPCPLSSSPSKKDRDIAKESWDIRAVVEYIGRNRQYGQTREQVSTKRYVIATRCLEELFAIISQIPLSSELSLPPLSLSKVENPVTQSKTENKDSTSNNKRQEELSKQRAFRLAKAVLPFTVLRAALPLQSYITDQPLRGRLPHTTGIRNELIKVADLLYKTACLGGIVEREEGTRENRDTATTSAAEPQSNSLASSFAADAHLFLLYPVLCDAVRVSRSDPDGSISEKLAACLGRLGRSMPVMLRG